MSPAASASEPTPRQIILELCRPLQGGDAHAAARLLADGGGPDFETMVWNWAQKQLTCETSGETTIRLTYREENKTLPLRLGEVKAGPTPTVDLSGLDEHGDPETVIYSSPIGPPALMDSRKTRDLSKV